MRGGGGGSAKTFTKVDGLFLVPHERGERGFRGGVCIAGGGDGACQCENFTESVRRRLAPCTNKTDAVEGPPRNGRFEFTEVESSRAEPEREIELRFEIGGNNVEDEEDILWRRTSSLKLSCLTSSAFCSFLWNTDDGMLTCCSLSRITSSSVS